MIAHKGVCLFKGKNKGFLPPFSFPLKILSKISKKVRNTSFSFSKVNRSNKKRKLKETAGTRWRRKQTKKQYTLENQVYVAF